jgi:small subunit ribosomal protein S7
MSRKHSAEKRQLLPDPKYHDVMVTRFINNVMRRGKKSVAERIFYGALEYIEQKTGQQGLVIFKKAIDNVKPIVEVRSRRIGGSTYQVPTEVRYDRQISLAIRWLISYSAARSERTMTERLASEFIAASKGEGSSIKKREDTHKMAEANKAFSHYRW